MRKGYGIFYGTLIFLLLLLAITSYFYHLQVTPVKNSKDLTIKLPSQQTNNLSLQQLKMMPSIKAKVTLPSNESGSNQCTFQGVPLTKLLARYLANQEWKGVTVLGEDGYSVYLDRAELERNKEIMLAYCQNDQPIREKKDGRRGLLRLIIPGDKFAQRWCNYVTKLEVK